MVQVLPEFGRLIKFFVMVFGHTMNSHETFVERLTESSNYTQVNSVNDCDFIIAFVSIVSRSGTDIESALHKISANRPLVLVVLHHTFDENYVAPDSKLCVRSRSDVFAVDCLHHEDEGMLRCLRNDDAFSAVKQHLRDVFPGEHHVFCPTPYICPEVGNRLPRGPQRFGILIGSVTFFFIIIIITLSVLIWILMGKE